MNLAIIQNAPSLHRGKNEDFLKACCQKYTSHHLVVFPELSLNGYLIMDGIHEDAYGLEELQILVGAMDCAIVAGAVVRDGHRFYNACIYAHGDTFHVYYKNHLPTFGLFQEGRFFTQGTHMRCFEGAMGKTALLICQDLWDQDDFGEIGGGLDVLIVLSASPARGFGDELEIQTQWMALLRSFAITHTCKVVFANRIGFEDGLGFWGGSCVLDCHGHLMAQAPLFESCVLEVQL